MNRSLAKVSVIVRDYDEAIDYYVKTLDFVLIADEVVSEDKRWVVVSPSAASAAQLLLAKAKNEQELEAIGNQTGGRVFLFLETDDFWRDYNRYKEAGVDFVETPRSEAYGDVVVFKDLYGNKWDLIGHRSA
jgi:catechol 2,3-dioxygenase-like lactoylglutathione lyase family enzyme|tara:strand:- start:31 stop:426 length:396 start_codon:yes stop_codon:yes gene_type:complete